MTNGAHNQYYTCDFVDMSYLISKSYYCTSTLYNTQQSRWETLVCGFFFLFFFVYFFFIYTDQKGEDHTGFYNTRTPRTMFSLFFRFFFFLLFRLFVTSEIRLRDILEKFVSV